MINEKFGRWVTSHPYTILLLATLCTIMLGAGAKNLSFSNDYRLFFSLENPQLHAFEKLQNTYTKSNNVLIVIAPQNGDVFTQKTLALIEELTKTGWQTPYSTRVDSITNFQQTYANGDDLIVEDLISGAAHLNAAELRAKRETTLNEPLLLHNLISPGGDVTAINIAVYLPEEDSASAPPKVMEFINVLVDSKRAQYPDHTFHVTGMVAMNDGLQKFSEADLKTLIPITFFAVLIGLAIMLRSTAGTLATVIVIIFSIVATMGIAGWQSLVLTPSSIGAPTIIATLAIADCVHLLSNYRHALREHGRQQAMVHSLTQNFNAIFLTSLTTAGGLLTLNFSDAPPLRDLGNIAAVGVTIAFILTVTLAPALMMILPQRKGLGSESSSNERQPLANFVIGHWKGLLIFMPLLTLLLALFIPNNQLNDEFHKFFSEKTTLRQAADFTNDRLTGIYEIHYSLASGEPGGISNPEYLAVMERFIDWYRQQDKVVHVYSILDIMKRLNMNMHENDPAWYRIPDERELSAQYLLLYEMSLPLGLDLNDRINIDKSATRVTITLNSLSSQELLDLEQRAQQWLQKNAPRHMWTEGASPATMFAHIGQRNIHSMLWGIVAALFMISFILIFALRSVKFGIISLIPNIVPIIMAYGLWGLLVGQIGFALSIVASMSLGIIVDDTIHFLYKYLHARRDLKMNTEAAIRYAFATVGRAIWITSVVLGAGFLILSFSEFQFNAGTGALMSITIACALIADFLLLPALLIFLDRDPPPATATTQ